MAAGGVVSVHGVSVVGVGGKTGVGVGGLGRGGQFGAVAVNGVTGDAQIIRGSGPREVDLR